MVLFDGIVFSLQETGGISVLFSEIISRMPAASYELMGFRETPPTAIAGATYSYHRPRLLERYRRARTTCAFDVFHSTYYRLPTSRRSKVVTTVYDFVYERFAPVHKRAIHGLQKQKAIAGSDRIICISESTRRDLLEFSGQAFADRTVVIPLGASDTFHPLRKVTVLPQVLFVGTRGGYKNFAGVVEALSPLRDITLLCVGGGAFTRTELDLLERRIPRRYRFEGYLSGSELNRAYNSSLCLAYPSLYEGFGIPVLEAMRAGCPVIAVNCSSIPEVSGDAALLLETGRPDEIRDAIQQVVVTATRNDMVSKGSERAALFSWDETYRRTTAVYEELSRRRLE
ncbi:MAG TPA: glycosyltransferase family 1 protein [Gemmatimonadales bacterium]